MLTGILPLVAAAAIQANGTSAPVRKASEDSAAELRRLAELLRTARRQAGLTLQQVADRIGVTKMAVSYWERGRVRPNLDARIDLAQALGIPFEQLLPPSAGGLRITSPVIAQIARYAERLPPQLQQVALMQLAALATLDDPPD